MLRHKWFLIGGFCVLCVSLVCAYNLYLGFKTLNMVKLPVPDCDLRVGPCVTKLDSGEGIILNIKPTHMPVLTPLQLEVKTENIKAKRIYIYFKGAEMNMGEFRYKLEQQKDGSWATQTILPTCIHDQMVWHAVIHIESSKKRYSAPFVFINQRPQGA